MKQQLHGARELARELGMSGSVPADPLNELLKQQARPDPLAGKVVCVVGAPGRIEGYREALAERGAELRFVCGLDGQVHAGEAVSGSDAVVLDVGYAQHKTTMAARKRADKLGLPVVMAAISGMRVFKDSLGRLEQKFERKVVRSHGFQG